MSSALLFTLTLLTIIMLLHGLAERGRFHQYPFLAATIFLAFILPQVPGLLNSHFVDQSALAKTLFMATLCLAACGAGWHVGVRCQGPRQIYFSETRLLQVAAFLSLAGAYFFYKFGQLPDEERLRGMLTGTAVMHLFFAKLLTYGMAIALLCYALRPSKFALYIILFDLFFYLERAVIAGRRSDMAGLFLMVSLALWFQRRWSMPRPVVIGGICMAFIGLLAADDYRQSTYLSENPDWSAVLDIDLSTKWEALLSGGGEEMRNAVHVINRAEEAKAFNYGLSHWNSTVFAYVPAQLVGYEFKYSLMIDLPNDFEIDYNWSVGTTSTGMADAFTSFWYFGAIKFFVIALFMGVIYASSVRGHTAMQLTYMLSMIPSLQAITHFTNEMVIAWIHMAVFLGPALYYAMLPRREVVRLAPEMPWHVSPEGLPAVGMNKMNFGEMR